MNKPTKAKAPSEAGETAMTNGTAVNGVPSPDRTLENATSPKMATLLGEIVWLLTQSPAHRHLFLADLEWTVMPALKLRQVYLFRSKERIVGFAAWAKISEEVEKRLSCGVNRLAPHEWNSGENLWLMDLVTPFGGAEHMISEMKVHLFPNRVIKLRASNREGKQCFRHL